MRNALLDGYRDTPRFSSVRRLPSPQADLNLYPAMASVDPFRLTTALVSQRVSTAYYLLLNAHYLQRPGGSFMELPWKGDPPLLNQIEAIDWAVCGCPVRLRKWMMSTLIGAKARGVAELDWKFVSKFAPLAAERKTAREDFKAIQRLRGPLPKKTPDRDAASGTNPFARPLTRPTVGFDAA